LTLNPKLSLHGYYRSSAAFRVRIALNLKGLEYRNLIYHLRKGEQRSPRYRALNPQGLVPSLEVDGVILTQSLAIVEYLDELYPQPSLLPADPVGRAKVRAMAQLIACDIHPINNLRVLEYLRTEHSESEANVRRWYAHWIEEGFAALEIQLGADRPTAAYCYGDSPSLADICLVPQVVNARNFAIDLKAYPNLVRVADRALALPAFASAHPQNQPDAE
jgi:maleylacetoacetate isomerase